MAEFGRFLLYNVLIDDECSMEDSHDSDEENNEREVVVGYKQMILVLQSQCVETGKSFFCELLSRMYHGKKQDIYSVLSFESAKWLLSKGEPVIIGKIYSLI